MSNGLHQQVTAKRAELMKARATANDPDASAQESHEAFEKLPRLQRELEALCQSAHVGEHAAAVNETLIGKLNASPVKSAELQLSIRDLETAGFRLRQHLGQEG